MHKVMVLVALLQGACLMKGMGGSTLGGGGADADGNVTIPNVVGMQEPDAREALAAAGVGGTVNVDTRTCGSVIDGKVIELGQVCAQQPVEGVRQNARLQVTIGVQQEDPYHGNVGQPGEWHLIPSLVGMTVEQVKVALPQAGFPASFGEEFLEVRPAPAPGCAANTVCKSAPEGPSRNRIDNRLILYVGEATQ